MTSWNKEKHTVWALRHEACKRCHWGCDGSPYTTREEAGPCICGPEPCQRCGHTGQGITETGCVRCDKQYGDGDYAKSIDIENSWYMIYISCPYCEVTQGVEGHNRGHHPLADALECYDCGKKAWLGVDKHGDYDNINDDEVGVEIGATRES